jgi:hypothetical protein
MKRTFELISKILMVLGLSVHAFAAPSVAAAMLRSSGGVSVNGNPATTSVTTVFSGDRIETGPKSVGNVSFNGSSILLDENSNVVFSGQDMDFTCGGGTLKTAQGTAAKYGRYGVKPAQDSARFQVQQTGATLRVSALEGNLVLSDGAKNFNLAAGNTMNVPYTGCVQMAKADPQDLNVPSPNSPSPVGPTPINTSTGLKAAIAAPAIVVSLALAAILAVSQNPVSPAGP